MGASCAIIKLCQLFGAQLIEKIPVFEQILFGKISQFFGSYADMSVLAQAPLDQLQCNELMTSLQLLEIAGPHLHACMHERLFEMLPQLGLLITHPLKAVSASLLAFAYSLAY